MSHARLPPGGAHRRRPSAKRADNAEEANPFSVDQARRGRFSPSDIINPRPIDELRQLLKR